MHKEVTIPTLVAGPFESDECNKRHYKHIAKKSSKCMLIAYMADILPPHATV